MRNLLHRRHSNMTEPTPINTMINAMTNTTPQQAIESSEIHDNATTTRVMRDSVTPNAIPVQGTQIVAVYRNGKFAANDAAVAARFPGVPVAWIDVIGNDPAGAGVLDVENGDATPATAVHWVAARHTVEAKPVLYVNRSNVTAVFNAMAANGFKIGVHFRIWLATLDGTTTVPDMTGVVAVQAKGSDRTGANYDESVVYDATWHAAPVAKPVTPPASSAQGLLVTSDLEVANIASTDGGHTWTRK
jgi:hypothetical protein